MVTKESIMNCLINIKSNYFWEVEELGKIFRVSTKCKMYNFDIYILNEYDDFQFEGELGHFTDISLYEALYEKLNNN